MASEIPAEVIKTTQDMLGKHIKKPPLTAKLLAKPPFRFLHDIVTGVIKDTGFLKGLYDETELQSENVKDREAKIAFLQKLIDVLKIVTKKDLVARPSKIVAGLEPEKTNELLQTLAYALNKKLDSTKAIKALKEGKTTMKTKNDIKTESKKPTKTETPREKSIDRRTTPRRTDESLERGRRSTNKLIEEKPPTKRSDSKTTSSKQIKDASPRPSKVKVSKSETIKKPSVDDIITHKENIRPDDDDETIRTEYKDPPVEPPIQPPSELKEINTNKTTPKDVKEAMPPPQPVQPSAEPLHATESMTSIIEEHKESKSDNEVFAEMKMKKSSATNDRQKERPPSVQRPRTSLRPPSVRPSSARPGAPRLQRSDTILLPQDEPAILGGVKVIIENTDVDEEETVVVETVTQEDPTDLKGAKKDELPAEKGHLVNQILEQIEEDPAPSAVKVDVERERGGVREKELVTKETEQLRESIQKIMRAVNPLGRLMNFLQEDIDSMFTELEQWKETNSKLNTEITEQQRLTDESIKPLKEQLIKLEENIVKQQEQIMVSKANIFRNDKRIEELLARIN